MFFPSHRNFHGVKHFLFPSKASWTFPKHQRGTRVRGEDPPKWERLLGTPPCLPPQGVLLVLGDSEVPQPGFWISQHSRDVLGPSALPEFVPGAVCDTQ